MSTSTILYLVLSAGAVFLMMRMHGGHGGHGGGGGHGGHGGGRGGGHGGGGGCGSHGSSDKDPAQPTSEPKPVAADEAGRAKSPHGHAGY